MKLPLIKALVSIVSHTCLTKGMILHPGNIFKTGQCSLRVFLLLLFKLVIHTLVCIGMWKLGCKTNLRVGMTIKEKKKKKFLPL